MSLLRRNCRPWKALNQRVVFRCSVCGAICLILFARQATVSEDVSRQKILRMIETAKSITIRTHHVNPTKKSVMDSFGASLATQMDASSEHARNMLAKGLTPESRFCRLDWKHIAGSSPFATSYSEIRFEFEDDKSATILLDMPQTWCRISDEGGTTYGQVNGMLDVPGWTGWVWSQPK